MSEEAPSHLDLEFSGAGGRVRLDRRVARWPFVVGRVFPAAGTTGAPSGRLVVQQAGGGLHDGDRWRQRVSAGGVVVEVRGQGAVLVHPPASGPPRGVVEDLWLGARAGAVLEHCSEPRLLLPGARLHTRTTVEAAAGAAVVVAESVARHPATGPVDGGATTELRVHGASRELLALDRTDLPPRGAEGGVWDAVGTVAVLVGDRSSSCPVLPRPDLPEVTGAVLAATRLPRRAGLLVRWCARDVAAGRRAEAVARAAATALLAGLAADRSARSEQREHPLAQGEDSGLGAAAHTQLREHVLHVRGDGAPAGVQVPGDLLVGRP